MALRKTQPVRFSPKGLSDTQDSTTAFPGAMQSLQNLIADPGTANMWVPRPAAIKLYDFAAFTSPGAVSVALQVGSRVYGMIGSGLNAGRDQPFCYDVAAGANVAISGITAAKTPLTQPTSGVWTPPTMDLIGTKIVVTHSGFSGGANPFFGWFDISNPSSVSWNAGNTAGTALPVVPTAVQEFGQRAWFLCNTTNGQPSVIATDVLDPLTRSNATYVLTFGDNIPLTALAGLPLSNQLGGVIQSLLVFKGAQNIFQVTGDFASTNNPIAQNTLNVATGTLAPRSIATTPKGLMFMAPDGVRLIDFDARVSDPIGITGTGITVPFIYANVPSRVAAACNSNVYRISVQNNNVPGSPWQEFWFDIARDIWTGPHTFPCSCVVPFDNTFIAFGVGVNAALWQSDNVVNITSSYVENGAALTVVYQTSMLPDPGNMAEFELSETTVNFAFASGASQLSFSVVSPAGSVLSSVVLNSNLVTYTWGTRSWGTHVWLGEVSSFQPRPLYWSTPVFFERMAFRVSGQAGAGLKLGDIYMRWRQLGYLTQ